MYAGTVIDPEDETFVDSAMCVFMKGPNSYTGEDSAEIHCHGGDACSGKVMELTLVHGCRPAEPGEFTRRAFMNGKMDLTQAQAVADIVNAQSNLALRQAGLQLSGGLSDRISIPKRQLLDLLAEIEARIDFPEEDTGEAETAALLKASRLVKHDLESLLATYSAGSLIREGVGVAITGRPNVGKSSLMNSLLGRERVITSSEPGTTRDYIEEQIVIGGITVRLTDTAGIRDAQSDAERTGIEMAKEMTLGADIRVIVVDASEALSEQDLNTFENASENAVIAVNKSDLNTEKAIEVRNCFPGRTVVPTSAKTGEGITGLKEAIRTKITAGGVPVENNEAALTNLRHKQSTQKALEATDGFISLLERGESAEIVSIKVKEAMDSLGEITGETSTEEILGVIFSNFCIGK